MALHEGLGEILGAFQLRGFLRGAEDGKTFAAEDIHKPLRKRGFGADDRKFDAVRFRKLREFFNIGDGEVFYAGFRGRAGVAGSNPDFVDAFGQRETPGESMFAAAAAHNENFHSINSDGGKRERKNSLIKKRRTLPINVRRLC